LRFVLALQEMADRRLADSEHSDSILAALGQDLESQLLDTPLGDLDKELQELLTSFDKELQEPPREVELRRHAGKLEIRRSQSTAGAPICAPSKKRARSLADEVERERVKHER